MPLGSLVRVHVSRLLDSLRPMNRDLLVLQSRGIRALFQFSVCRSSLLSEIRGISPRVLGITKESFHHIFIHADRRAEDSRSDIGYVRELEESLYRTIFSVWTVEDRKNNIDLFTSRMLSCKTEFSSALRRERDTLSRSTLSRLIENIWLPSHPLSLL